MRAGKRIRHLVLKAASSRRLHSFEARAESAIATAIQHVRRLRNFETRAESAITTAIQHVRRSRRPSLISRWKYTRLENDTIIRLKPRSIILATLRSACHILKLIFLQAKYLIPIEAEAVGVWIM